MRRALRAVADSNDLSQLLNYQHHGATAAQFDTAASWLAHADIPVVPDRLIITAGLQHAMTICIAALCEPGDLVFAESLTYPGIRALGIMHHLRLQGVAMDAQGLVPDAFEAACRGGSVRALYTIPTLQNPTAPIRRHPAGYHDLPDQRLQMSDAGTPGWICGPAGAPHEQIECDGTLDAVDECPAHDRSVSPTRGKRRCRARLLGTACRSSGPPGYRAADAGRLRRLAAQNESAPLATPARALAGQ